MQNVPFIKRESSCLNSYFYFIVMAALRRVTTLVKPSLVRHQVSHIRTTYTAHTHHIRTTHTAHDTHHTHCTYTPHRLHIRTTYVGAYLPVHLPISTHTRGQPRVNHCNSLIMSIAPHPSTFPLYSVLRKCIIFCIIMINTI